MLGPDTAAPSDPPLVGILAMQGAFAEHAAALGRCGAATRELRAAGDINGIDAVVIPGGESTAMRKGLERTGMYEPLRGLIAAGLPALGTCAGLIVLAAPEPDGAPAGFGLLDVAVARNGFGPQVRSFEGRVRTAAGGAGIPGVFIRAPRLTALGEQVTPIAWIDGGPHDGEVVAVQQGAILAATFHPELTPDTSMHELLLEIVRIPTRA